MLRKGLAVAVILLFIGVAFIPNVSAYDKNLYCSNCGEKL